MRLLLFILCVCLSTFSNFRAQNVIPGKNITLPNSGNPIYTFQNYVVKASENVVLHKGTTPTNGFRFDARGFSKSFIAKIDLDLIQDVTVESPPSDIFAGTNRTFDASKEVGKIPGDYSVDASGGVNYSIPIQLSPGSNGVQPNLSITYSTSNNISNVGLGWGIAGLSSITRGSKNKYYDGISEIVQLDGTDAFLLDCAEAIYETGLVEYAHPNFRVKHTLDSTPPILANNLFFISGIICTIRVKLLAAMKLV
ncbi:MAG: hypothetical protein ACJARP_000329 [Vicingaceae bacterium]|jgi:hypothetical protein